MLPRRVEKSDYVRAVPHLIAPYVKGRFTALGTDGFGRSNTRAAQREFFEVDAASIVIAALESLAEDGKTTRKTVTKALRDYGIDDAAPAS